MPAQVPFGPRALFRRIVAVLGLVVALAACDHAETPEVPAPGTSPRPSVLLITLDTLRADAVGYIGGHDHTPTIDALARDGFGFDHAVSPAPLTLPAHASILSGLFPHHHGVHDNGQVVPIAMPLLQERLRESGYATAAFVSAYVLDPSYGLDRGFDHYDATLDTGTEGWVERRAQDTVAAAIAWIGQRKDPWFVWVHLYDPHAPYEPPPEYLRPGPTGAYEGEVAYVDAQLSRLLAAVRKSGPEPLIVLTADHGEAFGEHGELTHGLFVYDTTMRVPLVFHHPDFVSRGSSTQSPRLVDIAPTVLSLLGLAALPDTQGVDLSPTLAGESQTIPDARLETMQPWITYGWHPLTGIRSGNWKYIEAPTPELYDLATDPGELTNLFDEAHPEGARLRVLLDASSAEAARYEPDAGADPESIARLQSLGYVGSGGSLSGDWSQAADAKTRLPQFERLLAAETLLRQGRFDLAKARFESVLETDPNNRFATLRLGMGFLKTNEPARAIPYLQRSVELDPRQAEARFALADALTRMKRYADAIPHWQETVALQPRRFGAWANLGSTLNWMGKPSEAAQAMERAVELAPEHQGLRTNLGLALLGANKRDDAIEVLLQAGAIDPAAFAEPATLAMLLLERGRKTEAEAWLDRVPAAAKQYGAAQFHLARLRSSSNPERAREHLAKALIADPRVREYAETDPALKQLQSR